MHWVRIIMELLGSYQSAERIPLPLATLIEGFETLLGTDWVRIKVTARDWVRITLGSYHNGMIGFVSHWVRIIME